MDYFQEIIARIRKRPGMFLGSCSITALRTFLDGYGIAQYDMMAEEAEETLQSLPFSLFHSFAANRCIKPGYKSGMGWNTIILKDCENDEEKALLSFFKLYDEFITLSIMRCYKAVFNENNINHHYTAYEATKIIEGDKTLPAYVHPIDAYILELSNEAGFIRIIRTEWSSHLDMWIESSKEICEAEIRRDFENLLWQEIEWDETLKNDLVIWNGLSRNIKHLKSIRLK